MASVRLEKVNKIYQNGVHAVKDADLDIADKAFMVLVGPSGCGKTLNKTECVLQGKTGCYN